MRIKDLSSLTTTSIRSRLIALETYYTLSRVRFGFIRGLKLISLGNGWDFSFFPAAAVIIPEGKWGDSQ